MGAHTSHKTKMSTNVHKDGCKYWAEFDREYFSEGSFRYAFRGKYRGNGPLAKYNRSCVTKVFKATHAKNLSQWKPDLSASKKAQKFAEHFNIFELYKLNISHKRRLSFVIPLIAKTEEIARFKVLGFIPARQDRRYVLPQDYVAIEPFLNGRYEKFNSNGGYECDNSVSLLLPAFCHWTWHISGHRYMVCDLQGVKCQNDYKLTDPVVHSVYREFGRTDLGVTGMEHVLANHKCNDVCRQLRLPLNPMRKLFKPDLFAVLGGRRTSYSYELTMEQRRKNEKGTSGYFQRMPAVVE